MKNLRLRFWALMQCAYDILRDIDGPLPLTREDGAEDAKQRWLLFKRSVLHGHLNLDFFWALDQHDPKLLDPRVADDLFAVMLAARKRLLEYVELGPEKSGYLGGYLEAVSVHLFECEECQQRLRELVKQEMQTVSLTKEAYAGFTAAERDHLLLRTLPARVLAALNKKLN